MENVCEWVAFILLSGSLLISSLLVVTIRNLVNSVLWLIVVFLSLAGIFVLLDAEFLAAVQVLVYAGGVCIMVVFGVMLVQRDNMQASNTVNRRFKAAGPLGAGFAALAGIAAAQTPWLTATQDVPEDTVQALAPVLFSRFVIPLEAAAILLTVALTGALLIVKEVRSNGNKS